MSEPVPQLSVSTPAAPEDRVRAFVEIFGQKWVGEFNDPVVFRNCSLSSKAALQFYRRDFAEMSRLLFADTMYRRRAGFDQAVLDAFIEAATNKLAEVQALIAVQCQRLVKLCESNGQPTDAAYVHQQQMLVPIISPHAASYLRCLLKLEELHRISASAMLNGVIDGEQFRVAEHHGHKAIRSLSGVLRNEYVKVRREAERVRAEASGAGVEPVPFEEGNLPAPDGTHQALQVDDAAPQEPQGASASGPPQPETAEAWSDPIEAGAGADSAPGVEPPPAAQSAVALAS